MSIMTHLDAQSQDTMNMRLLKFKEFQLLVNILYKGTTLENDIYFKQRNSDTIYFPEEEPILTNKDDSAL